MIFRIFALADSPGLNIWCWLAKVIFSTENGFEFMASEASLMESAKTHLSSKRASIQGRKRNGSHVQYEGLNSVHEHISRVTFGGVLIFPDQRTDHELLGDQLRVRHQTILRYHGACIAFQLYGLPVSFFRQQIVSLDPRNKEKRTLVQNRVKSKIFFRTSNEIMFFWLS